MSEQPFNGAVREWLQENAQAYSEQTGALGDMYYKTEDGIPAFEQIDIDDPTARYLLQRKEEGIRDELLIVPSARTFGLIGDKEKRGIFRRYSARTHKKQSEPITHRVWEAFPNHSPLHDHNIWGKFQAAVLLGDVKDPLDPSRPANEFDEPGLVYTGLHLAETKYLLAQEQKEHTSEGRKLIGVTAGQLIMSHAGRGLRGEQFIDEGYWNTTTKLVHYPVKILRPPVQRSASVEVSPTVLPLRRVIPTVYSLSGKLVLAEITSQPNWHFTGIRRAIVLPVQDAA